MQFALPKKLDLPLTLIAVALVALGIVMVSSVSFDVMAYYQSDPLYNFVRHLFYLLISLIGILVVLYIPINLWHRFTWYLLGISFILLALVFVPGIGKTTNGATRWINLVVFNFQPSEIAKIFGMVFLAGYLVRRQGEVRENFIGFLKPFVMLVPMAFLFMAEPDFGSTVVLMGASLILLFLGGVNVNNFFVLVILGVLCVIGLVYAKPYRIVRITGFIDPFADEFGSGFQLVQSLIAFGRGGVFGVGLGNSTQKQFYLPEATTDFVFAILAEELGLIGALCCVLLFCALCVRAIQIGVKAELAGQLFAAYFAYGLALLWLGQFLISVGVNIGILPTKGLTLPFISYGGSSLVVCFIMVGILLRIDWETRYIKELVANEEQQSSSAKQNEVCL